MNIELCNEPKSEGPIHFYELRYYWLSNFSSFAVDYYGYLFPTSEHAYQAHKFITNNKLFTEIRTAKSAHEAMLIARRNKAGIGPDWEQKKRGIMAEIVGSKLDQHEYIQRKLIETGGRELIEVSPIDSYWGWGPEKNGRNELGKIWMELRSELQKEDSQ